MAVVLKPCGTFAAYARHKRNKETPCGPCAQAARDQKNVRVEDGLAESAQVVTLAIASEPAVDHVNELDEALENLRIVKAAMGEAPANAVAALSKRREELVSWVSRLQDADKPKVSAFDQLAQRRLDRTANASY